MSRSIEASYLAFCLMVMALSFPASCPAAGFPTPPLPNALIPEQPSWAKNHPRVLFDQAGLARVQKRIHDEPEIAALWNQLKAQCDSYVDPRNPSYIDASKAFDNNKPED